MNELAGRCRQCGALLPPPGRPGRRPRVYCSRPCLCRANATAMQTWSTAAILAALGRYVEEFGPLPGGGRYGARTRGRLEYPSQAIVEHRFGSLRAAGLAAEVVLDLAWRDWLPDELDRLDRLVGQRPTLADVARTLGRRYNGARYQACRQGLFVQGGHDGRMTAREVGAWLHYSHAVIATAVRLGVIPADKIGRSWQIRPAALLAAEGIRFGSLADLDPDLRRCVEADWVQLRSRPGARRERIAAWQAYRQAGVRYPWRRGEIADWWARARGRAVAS